MTYAKDGGIWKEAIAYVKNAGVWQTPKDRWVKVNGVWKQMIPYGVLNLRTSAIGTDSRGVIYSSALDRFLLPTTGVTGNRPGNLGGSDTHGGLASIYSSVNTGSSTLAMTNADSSIGFTDGAAGSGSRSHSHSQNFGHSHNTSYTTTSLITRINFLPYVYSDYFTTDSVIFTGGTSLTDGVLFSGGYIVRCAGTYGTNSGSSHTHGNSVLTSGSHNTGTYTVSINQKQKDSGTWYRGHAHSLSHAAKNIGAIDITHRTYRAYRYNGTNKLYLNDLPAGSVIFSVFGEDPIEGWALETAADNRFIKTTVNSPVNGGSTSHNHSGTPSTGLGYNAGATAKGRSGSKSGEYVVANLSHSHTFSDNHAAHDIPYPPYIEVAMYRKL